MSWSNSNPNVYTQKLPSYRFDLNGIPPELAGLSSLESIITPAANFPTASAPAVDPATVAAGAASTGGLSAALGPIGAGLGIISTLAGLYNQYQAKKEAEKAQKEQRKQDAYTALMQAASGATPTAPRPVQAAPVMDWGAPIGQLANMAERYDARNIQADNTAWEKKYKEDAATRAQQQIENEKAYQSGMLTVKEQQAEAAKRAADYKQMEKIWQPETGWDKVGKADPNAALIAAIKGTSLPETDDAASKAKRQYNEFMQVIGAKMASGYKPTSADMTKRQKLLEEITGGGKASLPGSIGGFNIQWSK